MLNILWQLPIIVGAGICSFLHKSVQEYLAASEVVRAIKNACNETLMSLNDLDSFVSVIESMRRRGYDMSDNIQHMERNKIEKKMARAIIQFEAGIFDLKKRRTIAVDKLRK